MKRTLISALNRRLRELAIAMVCLSVSGCEIFQEEDTCKYSAEDNIIWTSKSGITNFLPIPFTGHSWFDLVLRSGRRLDLDNVCPYSPVELQIKVKENFNAIEFKAFGYWIGVFYKYGEKFAGYKRYSLFRTSGLTWDLNQTVKVDELGILKAATVVSITMSVDIPYVNNEDLGKALMWSAYNIESISIKASYIKYR